MLCPVSKSGNMMFFESSYISFALLHLVRSMSNVQQIGRQASCYALNSIAAAAAERRREKGVSYSVQQCVTVYSEPAQNWEHFLHLKHKHFTCKMFCAGAGSLPFAHFTPGRPLVTGLQCIGETSQPPQNQGPCSTADLVPSFL